MKYFLSKYSIHVTLIITVCLLGMLCTSFAFGLQTHNAIAVLEDEVLKIEMRTTPPHIVVGSGAIGLAVGDGEEGYTASISKLTIEEMGTTTFVKIELQNNTDDNAVYVISNRRATRTYDGYTELTASDPYIVTPLTGVLTVLAGDVGVFTIMVAKLPSDSYPNVESWIGVSEQTGNQIRGELAIRICIDGAKEGRDVE